MSGVRGWDQLVSDARGLGGWLPAVWPSRWRTRLPFKGSAGAGLLCQPRILAAFTNVMRTSSSLGKWARFERRLRPRNYDLARSSFARTPPLVLE
jgi:hypothetical protein